MCIRGKEMTLFVFTFLIFLPYIGILKCENRVLDPKNYKFIDGLHNTTLKLNKVYFNQLSHFINF